MPRTTEEQVEQVARYAEILAAQKAAREASLGILLVVVTALASGLAFWFIAILVSDGSVAVRAISVAAASAASASVITSFLSLRILTRQRRDAERLASIRPHAPASPDSADPESAETLGSASSTPDQG